MSSEPVSDSVDNVAAQLGVPPQWRATGEEQAGDEAVLAALQMIIGAEAMARLTEAAKITERKPAAALRKAIEIYSTLLVREQAGWGVELQRGNGREIVPFPLD